jgi:cephalosporin-C deacetylase
VPLIDKPLAELREYMGINPRPADFDAYWDAALAEMRTTDPKIELIPGPKQYDSAEAFDLYFTGVGGSRIHAKYLRPRDAKEPHPGLVVLHGYSGHSGDWFQYLSWVAEGFSVVAMDCRGQGGPSQDLGIISGSTLKGHIIRGLDDKPENLLFRAIFLDCAQLAGVLMGMPEVDPERVGVMGMSQGGGLTLACAALEPRLKRAAPGCPFLCDYKRVWEMDLAKDAYDEMNFYFTRFDPRHEREDEVFTKLGYIDNQHLAPRIKAKVVMFTGLMDTICPPSSQFAAFNKITSEKRVIIYPDFAHMVYPDQMDMTLQFMKEM